MNIKNYNEIDKNSIDNREYNIWIGISVYNKYFTKENIVSYVQWALEKTKENILILIADEISYINLIVTSGYNKERALRKVLEKGEEKYKEVEEIKKCFSKDKNLKIKIVRWKEVTDNKNYHKKLKIVFDEFNKKEEFYNNIMDIVKEHWKNSSHHLEDKDFEELSKYILLELPVLLEAINYKGEVYSLFPYPGLGKLDNLIKKIQKREYCKEMAKKLDIKIPNNAIEVYTQ